MVPVTVIHRIARNEQATPIAASTIEEGVAPFTGIDISWLLSQIAERTNPDYWINQAMYDGDHWLNGDGWTGPRPDITGGIEYSTIMTQIERAFVSKNCIKEVVARHANGVLGREPSWYFTARTLPDNTLPRNAVPPTLAATRQSEGTQPRSERPVSGGRVQGEMQPQQDNAEAQVLPGDSVPLDETARSIVQAEVPLTEWWDKRKVHTTLRKFLKTALLNGRATLRLYIPPGLVNVNGSLGVGVGGSGDNTNQLADALDKIYLHHPQVSEATVVTNDITMQEMGIYVHIDEEGSEHAEVVYVDGVTKVTVIQEVASRNDGASSNGVNVFSDQMQMDLGGRLTICEIEIDPLVTEQVRKLNFSINKTLTMEDENINLAGFLERTILNGQLPGHYEDDPARPGKQVFVRDKYITGGGAVNSIIGVPMMDAKGAFQGIATPQIVYRQPVGSDTFDKSKMSFYRSLLEEVDQVHYLLSGDQYASGESRKQARADFEASLRTTRGAINEVLRWVVETPLALAGWITGDVGEFDELRAVGDARIDPGPATADTVRSAIELRQAGGLSRQNMMVWSGVEDPDAEGRLIAQEKLVGIEPVSNSVGPQVAGSLSQKNTNVANDIGKEATNPAANKAGSRSVT